MQDSIKQEIYNLIKEVEYQAMDTSHVFDDEYHYEMELHGEEIKKTLDKIRKLVKNN